MQYARIDNDHWDMAKKVWLVLEYVSRPDSSAVTVKLEDRETGEVHTRVVAAHQIEWIGE